MNRPTSISSFQKIINIKVVVLVIATISGCISEYTYYDDNYNILPSDIVDLEQKIEEFLLEVEPNFQSLLDNPNNSVEYNLTHRKEDSIPLSDENNYKQSVKSVVCISAEDNQGIFMGSGCIISSNGLIITNSHVAKGCDKVVVTTFDGRHFKVESVLVSDDLLDITFLKINAEGLDPFPIGNSDEITAGQKTLVIGHPEGFLNTLSLGNVSAIRNYKSTNEGENIQITNPISSGNSGGALLNVYGELIGIPTWSLESDENIAQIQNINFAVSINDAIELLNNSQRE